MSVYARLGVYSRDGGIWGFPKIRGTFLGVPIIRTVVFGGLYWGPLFWESTISGAHEQDPTLPSLTLPSSGGKKSNSNLSAAQVDSRSCGEAPQCDIVLLIMPTFQLCCWHNQQKIVPANQDKGSGAVIVPLTSGLDAGTQGSRPLEACRQILLNVGTTWGGPTVWAALIAPKILTLPDVRHREPTALVPMSREPRRPKMWST